MKPLRVGVIGVGYLGKFHAEKYARMKDVELAGRNVLQKGFGPNRLAITGSS